MWVGQHRVEISSCALQNFLPYELIDSHLTQVNNLAKYIYTVSIRRHLLGYSVMRLDTMSMTDAK